MFFLRFFGVICYNRCMDSKGFNLALGYLARRPHSVWEVREYLKKKLVSLEKSEIIIERLNELKFLDDEEFVRWWVRQRTEVRPKSSRLIKLELQRKGIERETIDSVYASEDTSDERLVSDWEKAVALLLKKKGKYIGLERNELYQKAGGLLARRGFEWEVIKRSIDEVFGK